MTTKKQQVFPRKVFQVMKDGNGFCLVRGVALSKNRSWTSVQFNNGSIVKYNGDGGWEDTEHHAFRSMFMREVVHYRYLANHTNPNDDFRESEKNIGNMLGFVYREIKSMLNRKTP